MVITNSMKEYKVYDDILNKESLKTLQEYFLKGQDELEWFYLEKIVASKGERFFKSPSLIETKVGAGFVISIPSENIQIDKKILSIIDEIKSCVEQKTSKKYVYTLRTKINLTKAQTFTDTDIINAIHLDRQTEHTSYIFYINTNNGYTLLYNDDKTEILQKVDCVENRILIFDGLIPHAGVPSKNEDKCVINCNLIEKTINTKLI